jgi:hypothetical protein
MAWNSRFHDAIPTKLEGLDVPAIPEMCYEQNHFGNILIYCNEVNLFTSSSINTFNFVEEYYLKKTTRNNIDAVRTRSWLREDILFISK